jgi:cell division protein ZapE
MQIKLFKDSFIKFCDRHKLEKNSKQIKILSILFNFIQPKKNFYSLLFKPKGKLCFYLSGGVGVGKTMIFNFFYKSIKIPKKRFHFNEFMILFHNHKHKNKKNSILSFVKTLKKNRLIYLDEFQVTNIVDAMILGKLFEHIFKENIKILITSNTKVDDLYKDGLQREQFLPFILIIKKNSIQKELIIDNDYRKIPSNKLQRVFYPINESSNFKVNKLFREITKGIEPKKIKLTVKGRDFVISKLYKKKAKFDFTDLCDVNLGAEDYIKIAETCKFIVIQNIPNFKNINANQQMRFITLIDILYEKKVSLMITIDSDLENVTSSSNLIKPFKRTISRLFELTAPGDDFFSTVD